MLAADRGLQRDGETMSMIPTYVTSIPNGTEKVRPFIFALAFHSIFLIVSSKIEASIKFRFYHLA